MRKWGWLCCVLLCMLLAGCGGGGEDEGTTAPPTTASEATTTTQAAATSQATTAPATVAPGTPFSAEVITTAQEWNAFARDYNENPAHYADTVDITIAGRLDFSDTSFVMLGSFSGSITGSAREDGFYGISQVEAPQLQGVWAYFGEIFELPAEADYSAAESQMAYGIEVQSPRGLFGAWIDRLSLVGLSFGEITAPGLGWLLGDSIATLELEDVTIWDCHLPHGRSLLCGNAGSLAVDRLDISDSSLRGHTWGSGLTRDVHGDLSLKNLSMYRVDVDIEPDLGGSGIALGAYSLTVSHVGGTASFEALKLSTCRVDGAWSYLLTASDQNVALCTQVQAYSCQLMALPRQNTVWGDFTSDLLFRQLGEEPVAASEIYVDDCIFSPIHSRDYYEALGWQLSSCMAMVLQW